MLLCLIFSFPTNSPLEYHCYFFANTIKSDISYTFLHYIFYIYIYILFFKKPLVYTIFFAKQKNKQTKTEQKRSLL